MALRKIRHKLILAFLVIVLFPFVPVSLLVSNFVDQAFKIGFDPRFEKALSSGVDVSRLYIQRERQEALQVIQALARDPVITGILQAPDTKLDASRIEVLKKRYPFQHLHLLNQDGASRSEEQPEPAFLLHEPELFVDPKAVADARTDVVGDSTKFVRALAPVKIDGKRMGIVLTATMLPEGFSRDAQEILSTLQIYKLFDLERQAVAQAFNYGFIALYVAILFFSVLFAYFFSLGITRPIKNLVNATTIISQGNLDYKLDEQARDEIGKLTRSFNRMTDELKAQQEKVVALEKKAAWQEIARKLAHEIKNPLTPIQLTVQQLKDQYDGSDTEYQKLVNDCYEIITEEIQVLRNLVKEFSEFARLPELNLKPHDLNQLIRDVVRFYADSPIEVSLDDRVPREIRLDVDRMRRVMMNLIDNSLSAVEDTGKSPRIVIATEMQEQNIVIRVCDNGAGISDEDRDKIFEPHFSTKKSGMGLGLAIVRNIVEKHNGSITATRCETAGLATEVTIVLRSPENRD